MYKPLINLYNLCFLEMMKIVFVDNCTQEIYLADVLIRCSNPHQGEISFYDYRSNRELSTFRLL